MHCPTLHLRGVYVAFAMLSIAPSEELDVTDLRESKPGYRFDTRQWK